MTFTEGSNRNRYLDPFNREIRAFVAVRVYRLADVCRRIERETAARW